MSRENEVVAHLNTHGPTPTDALPRQLSQTDRQRGAARFRPFHNEYTTVVYLFEDHDPETVVETYLETNPEVLDERSIHELIPMVADYGREWRAAIRTLLDDTDRLEGAWQR